MENKNEIYYYMVIDRLIEKKLNSIKEFCEVRCGTGE